MLSFFFKLDIINYERPTQPSGPFQSTLAAFNCMIVGRINSITGFIVCRFPDEGLKGNTVTLLVLCRSGGIINPNWWSRIATEAEKIAHSTVLNIACARLALCTDQH